MSRQQAKESQMSKSQVNAEFPHLYSLVEGEQIDEDIDWAVQLVDDDDNHEMLREAVSERAARTKHYPSWTKLSNLECQLRRWIGIFRKPAIQK